MRLDKFLKATSLAKRRAVAKEALDAGRLERDGVTLKPSYQVKIGDRILIHYASRDVLIRVDALPQAKLSAKTCYTVLSDTSTRNVSA